MKTKNVLCQHPNEASIFRSGVVGILVVGLLASGEWALAQQERPSEVVLSADKGKADAADRDSTSVWSGGMTALHLAKSPDEFDPAFPVAPALELAQWVKTYEMDSATDKPSPRLKVAEAQYLEVRKNGKRPWNSQEWMKEPDYYMRLGTRELALECF